MPGDQRIIVAHDLTGRSTDALQRGARLARTLGARLVIVHAVDDGLPARLSETVSSLARDELERLAAPLRAELGEGRVDALLLHGSPWRMVVEAANAPDCRLLVIGPHRWRGLGELFAGSFAERILRAAQRDVLLARLPAVDDHGRVLVGIDFSPASRRALLSAAELAPGAEIILVSAYHVLFRGIIARGHDPGEDPALEAEKRRLEREIGSQMDDFLADMPERLRGARRIIAEGGPAALLSCLAEYEEADLIAVGAHARGRLAELLLGSTARDLADFAPCDLLVAR
ncbi:Nucleotide-binding universal stress protein, UspA family [Meinhardsimonia xiamenensis]|uniref:Nucleotide-binding universal stress protein, UspA family n=1 Tax=Meinhardsimonia xiamenensis TaxID=990712 RepID=A0A1G9E423_9RHOB|nr:universal stress protein [Meinhardsimonia xiamenensis]PRX33934.1 nucleotide-binding universal stress UspA family protein [Meinhardsimonia xiamenensis]SDK70854.1 Nucleotide-binding universal stress protein, UspA family [Meinhardsimonia xiamenensis]